MKMHWFESVRGLAGLALAFLFALWVVAKQDKHRERQAAWEKEHAEFLKTPPVEGEGLAILGMIFGGLIGLAVLAAAAFCVLKVMYLIIVA